MSHIPDRHWAGRGFTRPGPGTEVPGPCTGPRSKTPSPTPPTATAAPDCDPPQLCDTHTERATRAQHYQQALDDELEASS